MATQLPAIRLQHQDPYDTVDLGQFLRTLRQRAGTIACFTGLAAGAALLHVLFAVPQFTAHGTLYLGDTQQEGSDNGDANGTLNLSAYAQQSDVETQIELLTTGTLIQRAVLETGLNTKLRPAGAAPLTYWRWRLFEGGSTQAFVPSSNALQVVDATLTGHYRLVTGPDDTYKLYPAGGLFGTAKPLLTGKIGTPAQTAAGALLVRFAQPGTDAASATDPDLAAPDSAPAQTASIKPGKSYDLDISDADALADGLAKGALNVTAGGSPTQPTKLASMMFNWSDPYQAMLFVNQLMQDYIATQLQWKTQAASVTEDFVTDQLNHVSSQLAQADQALSDYQAQTGIVDPQQAAQAAVQQMTQLQQQRGTLLLQQQALQQLHDAVNVHGGNVNPYLISETNDSVLSALTTSLSDAQVKLSQLHAEYTDNAQDVQIQQAQVSELRSSIRDLIDNDLKSATQSLADIDKLIASNRAQLQNQPAEALKVEALKRSTDQLDELSKVLTEKAEQAQLSKAATIIDTRIVTPSELPLGATTPRAVVTVVAGALAGLIAGLALVFAQRAFSGRYESEEQIRRAVQLPVFGVVPRQEQAMIGHSVFGPARLNAFSEAFQLIKRNIYRSTDANRAAAILVISASKQDGKTTIAANLAKTLADDGKRVLLLDCDFYLSRLDSSVYFSGKAGLIDWLRTGERPPLQSWPGGSFAMLPAGSTQPSHEARLDEAALRDIIETLSAEFDYIILDSPPLPIVSDGLVLGSVSDMILSVVSVSHTMRRAFDLHNELIQALDKPHGLIINGADAMNYGDSDAYFVGAARRRPKFTGWFRV